ncbi:hypothetical protein SAMN04488045_2077 [Thalassococcus halodurans]|uniref:Lipoprotein n=1 Tax=Thalassococcus halodurans TaxID=373675 RepID=A0A1H5YG16_9RHOB|nr:hypothetical protein [Thalassococcus halodurans]SEG22988.1 hypothetical protein SAMN04488045_2077 [Thalassococcus halodurans]
MTLSKASICLVVALGLSGCAAHSPDDVSIETTQQFAYRHDGPPALTLYTMVSNRSGSGAHSSIMINASQRVVFDPAGSVKHPAIAERGDVLYGITPQVADFYERAHARETYHVVIQRIEVSPEVAEMALRLAQDRGTVASAFCTNATSSLLSKLPGFEQIKPTFFPGNLQKQMSQVPGVTERKLFENDSDDKAEAIAAFKPEDARATSPSGEAHQGNK